MFTLNPDEEVKNWYNIAADLPTAPPPPLHPGTKEPIGPEDLAPLFPMDLILQEVSQERYVPIPEPILEVYRTYRPSPLYRARRWEKKLGTPARIYFKYEGVSPVGSHKLNTAIAQAYYNSINGVKKITTETGAGQWGTALSYACSLFDIECEVWQVGVSYDGKPQRRTLIEVFGATLHRSPSRLTESGRAFPEGHPGSLGIAISEAVEVAAQDPKANYSLGSVLNHVLLHQTIIGEETLIQLAKAGEGAPDVVVGCVGGGSNFGGLSFPFIRENLTKGAKTRLVAVEPTSCPTLTRGEYRYDFGDTAGLTPLLVMYTLGHDFVPSPIHAGGLRYHAMAPLVSHVVHEGLMEAVALHQSECFEAAVEFALNQGIVPAPESAHAVAQGRREALEAKEKGEERVIVIGLSGHGLLELGAYEKFLSGNLEDDPLSEEDLAKSMAGVPEI
ncbi:MAG: TrpB-like pyridoxal phosphate-dependent enzyme [Demequinaceae bacterium]|nr:TrpB-like pyridoxal phosphate-dependent enzyme [Demequinaceae bacterium]